MGPLGRYPSPLREHVGEDLHACLCIRVLSEWDEYKFCFSCFPYLELERVHSLQSLKMAPHNREAIQSWTARPGLLKLHQKRPPKPCSSRSQTLRHNDSKHIFFYEIEGDIC